MSFTPKQMAIAADVDNHHEDRYGLRLINPNPPRCMAIKTGSRPAADERCQYPAIYVTEDGTELCRSHAIRWVSRRESQS